MRSISGCTFLLLLAVNSWGQEKGTRAAKADPNAVEVRFADDSTVKMILQQSTIDVVTRYGKLKLPLDEIRRIEFGLRIPDETAKRIDQAIANLGSADLKQRDAASVELLELREIAYTALQRAAQSRDTEVARRGKEAIKTLSETVPADRLRLPRYDTIVALDFTIVGRVEAASLKARTPYFGEANLKLAELRSMRWLTSGRETKVTVDAGKHGGPQESWMDSGIEVRAGMTLQVAATGRVDLNPAPGEIGTSIVGPDGLMSRSARAAAAGFGPGGRGGRGFPNRGSGDVQSPGALIGRIGETGRVFVLGSRYEGTAPEDGKLYLRIVPSPNGVEPTGNYDVRVTTGR